MLESAATGINAYNVNVLASLAGITLFTVLCFADTPPVVWRLVFAALLVAGLWKIRRLRGTTLILSVFCLALLSIPGHDHSAIYWSPYQKLLVKPVYDSGEITSYELSTNDTWYQHIVNLSPDFLKRHPNLLNGEAIQWNAYNLPYRFSVSPQSVLVLGSGTGNDVAAPL